MCVSVVTGLRRLIHMPKNDNFRNDANALHVCQTLHHRWLVHTHEAQLCPLTYTSHLSCDIRTQKWGQICFGRHVTAARHAHVACGPNGLDAQDWMSGPARTGRCDILSKPASPPDQISEVPSAQTRLKKSGLKKSGCTTASECAPLRSARTCEQQVQGAQRLPLNYTDSALLSS